MKLFNNQLSSYCRVVLPAILGLLAFFYNISYTDDIDAYYSFYLNNDVGDYGFQLWENISHFLNLSFLEFENLTFLTILFLFSLVFYKFKVNTYIGVLLTILFIYVQIANQLRYFMAVPVLLLAFYYFFCGRRRLWGIVLSAVAFSLHSGIIAWISFIPTWLILERCSYSIKKTIGIFIAFGIGALVTFSSLTGFIISISSKYDTYTFNASSNLGTLFILSYPIFCISIVIYYYKLYGDKLQRDENRLAYAMTLFTIVWCIASFSGIQVINARYINAFCATWIIAMFSNCKGRNIPIQIYITFAIGAVFMKLLFPILVFGFNDVCDLNKITLIWQSRFVNYLF